MQPSIPELPLDKVRRCLYCILILLQSYLAFWSSLWTRLTISDGVRVSSLLSKALHSRAASGQGQPHIQVMYVNEFSIPIKLGAYSPPTTTPMANSGGGNTLHNNYYFCVNEVIIMKYYVKTGNITQLICSNALPK